MSDRCDIFAAPLFPLPRSLSEIAMLRYCAFRARALCAARSVKLRIFVMSVKLRSEILRAVAASMRGGSYCCTAVTSNRMCGRLLFKFGFMCDNPLENFQAGAGAP
jgi:hypothetical protein